MSFKLFDRVRVAVSGAPGTGSVTLGSPTLGFQSFSAAGASNGDTFPYLITDGSNWEIGVGTYSSTGPSVARTTRTSSSSGSAISFTSSAILMCTIRAEDIGGGGFAGGTPPAIVQTATSQSTTVTMGAAPTNGNLLVAFCMDTGSNPTLGSGWTQLVYSANSDLDIGIYYKTAGASESTTQAPVTGQNSSITNVIWEISGSAGGSSAFAFANVADDVATAYGGTTSALPVLTATLFLGIIVSAIPGTATIASAYGSHTLATPSGGVPAAYGSGDSTNSQVYCIAAMFTAKVPYAFAVAVIH